MEKTLTFPLTLHIFLDRNQKSSLTPALMYIFNAQSIAQSMTAVPDAPSRREISYFKVLYAYGLIVSGGVSITPYTRNSAADCDTEIR